MFAQRAAEGVAAFDGCDAVIVNKPGGAFYMTVMFKPGVLNDRQTLPIANTAVRARIEAATRKLKLARLLCLRAGWLADQQKPNILEASMSKAVAAQVGQQATSLGMELIGTVGARGDHLIEKLYRDVKAMDIVEGTGQIQRVIMARKLVQLPR